MGVSDLVLLSAKLVLYTAALLVIIAIIPGLPPYTEINVIEYPLERELVGPLAPNNILEKADILIGDEVRGAESVAADGDTIYFGSIGGNVYKFDGTLKKIAQTGEPCDLHWEQAKCGHPLGIRLDKDKNILVADTYKGILKINSVTGKIETIVKHGLYIGGSPVTYPDDLDVSKEGIIYWTDASQLPPEEGALEFLGGSPSGRLIQTDIKSGRHKVLMKNIPFANGVQLSAKQDFVLVCETIPQRVTRYYLEGPNKGKSDVFIDRLPGLPDNIRPNGKGGFYISLILPRDKMLDFLGSRPILRKLLLRIDSLIRNGISALEYLIPRNPYLGRLNSFMHNTIFFDGENKGRGFVVETDGDGKVIGSLQGEKSKVRMITQATIGDKYIYFGSAVMSKIYRMKRADLVAPSSS